MVIWTDYLRYRAELRGFDLGRLEQIVRFSKERYFDTLTRRKVAVGQHGSRLVLIPYDEDADDLTPATVHAVTRQQITVRVRTGRFLP